MSNLRTLRTAANLSQAALARAIGKPRQYIQMLESGKRDISGVSAKIAVQIAQALGVTVEELLRAPE